VSDQEQPVAPDILEGDPAFWSFVHSQLVMRENSDNKLAACIALTTRHFNAGTYGGEACLFPVTTEAVRFFTRPVTLDIFRDLIAGQLEATETARFYLLSQERNSTTFIKTGVFFTQGAAVHAYKQAVAADPGLSYKVAQFFWAIPDLLDPPTLEKEVTKLVRWMHTQGARLVAASVEQPDRRVEVSVEQLPGVDDVWSGPLGDRPTLH
jgi:hypothetical protein